MRRGGEGGSTWWVGFGSFGGGVCMGVGGGVGIGLRGGLGCLEVWHAVVAKEDWR